MASIVPAQPANRAIIFTFANPATRRIDPLEQPGLDPVQYAAALAGATPNAQFTGGSGSVAL